MSSFRRQSRRMALCGILAALALVFLCLGSIVPFATFCCPILAMVCMVPVVEEYGAKTALVFYAAVMLLALLMAPDKEVTLLYAFLGYYPALRPWLERRIRQPLLRLLLKLALGIAAVSAMYSLAIFVLGMTALAEDYAAEGTVLLVITAVLGCVVWVLCDMVLARFTQLYRHKLHGKIFRT